MFVTISFEIENLVIFDKSMEEHRRNMAFWEMDDIIELVGQIQLNFAKDDSEESIASRLAKSE